MALERDELEMRREERKRRAEREDKAFEVELEREKYQIYVAKQRVPKPIKVREMRENEDIDDYFRIFEMTAKAQLISQDEWLEKKAGEDFGQWDHRTRRYLNRWMTVAEAIDNREKILEQIVIERLLDGVGPELQVWLKERKPNTAEELANLANDYVQSRKGPLIDGKYVSAKRNDNKPRNDDFCKMRDKVYENNKGNPDKPDFGKFRDKLDKSKVKCFNCQEKGHYAHECRKKNKQNAAFLGKGYNTLGSYIVGNLNGNKVQMIIDSVITANGDRVEVALAWVTISSEQGIHRELVGVMRNLRVDCLLGRSSYGNSLAKKNLLDHWVQAVDLNIEPTVVYSDKNKSALVVTRRQAALVKAQTRLDKLTDKQNELAIKTLSPKEPTKDELSETIDLFGEDNNIITEPDPEKVCVKEPVADIDSSENGCQLETNILDRSQSQLINDQKKDVTLHNLTILNVPPEDTDVEMEQAKWEEVVSSWMSAKSFELSTEYENGMLVGEIFADMTKRKEKFEKKTGVSLDNYYRLAASEVENGKKRKKMSDSNGSNKALG
ncbi:Retrovirus-related Pol poly from transposon [Paramuricea clavata]|uniref:Retrovirus-related Pol poly from transposon n=1 Tax=Paramuricea clavata TaxID=317549 RepID=A0A7D9LKH6_PARCT|nr:Retrovirus-related Pol poly from transposon [Paramuricea clavata]